MRRALRRRPMHAPHDRLAKRVLLQLLDEWGSPLLEFPVSASDDQRFDLWFPGPAAAPLAVHLLPRHLRLLGRMTQGPCAFEVFSRAPQGEDLRECQRKQLNHHHNRLCAARRARKTAPPLFPLYILCAGRPSGFLATHRLREAPGWPTGFYHTDDHARLWVVVLSELPRTRETLLLRVLGPPATRAQAAQELSQLAKDDPERQPLLQLAATLRLAVHRDKKIPAKQKEDFMTPEKREIARIVEASEERGRMQGLTEGRGQGLARAVLQVLRARGITVTQALRQRIVSCSDVRQLTDWTRRAAVATSADDLFAST